MYNPFTPICTHPTLSQQEPWSGGDPPIVPPPGTVSVSLASIAEGSSLGCELVNASRTGTGSMAQKWRTDKPAMPPVSLTLPSHSEALPHLPVSPNLWLRWAVRRNAGEA